MVPTSPFVTPDCHYHGETGLPREGIHVEHRYYRTMLHEFTQRTHFHLHKVTWRLLIRLETPRRRFCHQRLLSLRLCNQSVSRSSRPFSERLVKTSQCLIHEYVAMNQLQKYCFYPDYTTYALDSWHLFNHTGQTLGHHSAALLKANAFAGRFSITRCLYIANCSRSCKSTNRIWTRLLFFLGICFSRSEGFNHGVVLLVQLILQ